MCLTTSMVYTHDKYVDALTQGSKFYGEIGDVPHLYIVHRRPLHEDEQSIAIMELIVTKMVGKKQGKWMENKIFKGGAYQQYGSKSLLALFCSFPSGDQGGASQPQPQLQFC